MMWRARSRSVALRLLLLAAITAAGPAGAATSWHLVDQRGGHLTVGNAPAAPALEPGAAAGTGGEHCTICQFGAVLRAFLPSPASGMAAPSHDLAVHRSFVLAHPDAPTATGHSGRAPPRAI